MAQYVYTMNRVGKVRSPKRVILRIFPLVLPGRQDRRAGHEWRRQIEPAAHHGGRGHVNSKAKRCRCRTCASASCPRSRSSIPARRCANAVEEGLGDILDAKKKLEDIYAAYAEPGCGLRQACHRNRRSTRRSSRPRGRLRPARWRSPPTRCGCRPGTRRSTTCPAVKSAASRCCRLLAVEARHAAAGRADQPPRCRKRGLARAVPAEISGDRDCGHARPLLPRQRGRVDPGARPRPRHSVEGQLQLVAGAEGSIASRPRPSRRARESRAMQKRAGMGALESEGAPGQEQGAHPALRGVVVARAPEAQRDPGDIHPGRRAPGQQRDRIQERRQGLRRPAC